MPQPRFGNRSTRLPDKIPSLGLHFVVPEVNEEDCEVHSPGETPDEITVLSPAEDGYLEYVSVLYRAVESEAQGTPTFEQAQRMKYLEACMAKAEQRDSS